MITSCFVGSTFAKYITKAEGTDNARVAKWGVLLSVTGNAFATQYAAEDEAYLAAEGEYSVVADTQVVAPGTNSELVGSNLVGHVGGTPEVAARYSITGTVTDIVLPAGTYVDYTHLVDQGNGTYLYTDTFELEKDYSPVKWNMVISGKGAEINLADALYENLPANLIAAAENYGLTPNGCSFFDAVKILKKVADNETYVQVVEAALGSIVSGGRNFQLDVTDDGEFTLSYDFDPNKEMDYTFTLSWNWAFEQENVELYDKADTFLGNWAAVALGQQIEGFVAPAAPSSYVIDATLVATATQID
jgi:hypothetical protein